MSNAEFVGRTGKLAVALGIGGFRRTATRWTVSVSAAALVVTATGMPAREPTESPAVELSAASTALILGGTTVPTPDAYYAETVKRHFIGPTHPDRDITYIPVTTPEEAWPITGLARLLWLVTGPAAIWGPGGPAWPDEPWWKLSGLFDLTFEQSIRHGVKDLEDEMAAHGNDDLLIYGYSQGAMIANREKRKLAEQYPTGTTAPNIDFVLSGDPNLPNGGLASRFPGLHVPVLDVSFDGPAPTDTRFHTVEINRQYDGIADFPLYPLNLIADLNAILGIFYVHPYDLDVSLPPDPLTSKYFVDDHGLTDTDYYFFPTADLPLFGPLRSLGVPEALIDVVEPIARWVVDLGYDRTIAPWEPTPARFTPRPDSPTDTADLFEAIGESITNALALFGLAPPPDTPGTVETTDAQPLAATAASVATRSIPSTPPTTGSDRENPNQTTTQPDQRTAVPNGAEPAGPSASNETAGEMTSATPDETPPRAQEAEDESPAASGGSEGEVDSSPPPINGATQPETAEDETSDGADDVKSPTAKTAADDDAAATTGGSPSADSARPKPSDPSGADADGC